MKKSKYSGRGRIPALLMAILLFAGQFAGAGLAEGGAYLEDYLISDGIDRALTVPPSLKIGEIWTGKAVRHNGDGTITVTLAAWGRIYPNPDNPGSGPLKPLAGDQCVTIVDDLGEFQVRDSLPPGVTPGGGNTVIWKVHQDDILGNAPATVSYDLELRGDPETFMTDRWYLTGEAVSSFVPIEGNPYYWTKTETTFDSFLISMNWNNGQGLNQGTIIDRLLDVVFDFGKNSSKEMEDPYGANAKWDTLYVNGKAYQWHLKWEKGNAAKSYLLRAVKEPSLYNYLKDADYRNLVGTPENFETLKKNANSLSIFMEFMREYYLK